MLDAPSSPSSAVDEIDEGPVDAEPEVIAEVEETAIVAGAERRLRDARRGRGRRGARCETAEEEAAPQRRGGRSIRGAEGARLIALNMALNGTPRDETARYLSQNFDLDDQDALLDEVYARVGD